MNKRLNEIAAANQVERQNLLGKVSNLTQDQFDFRPSSDRWSIGEILNHLTIMERRVAGLINRKVEEGRTAGHDPDLDEASVLDCLNGLEIPNPVTKVKAPEMVSPKHGIAKSELLESLSGTREKLVAAMESLSDVDPTRLSWPHPFFGDWNLYQWTVAVGQHEHRHAVQIDGVKSASGFPSNTTTSAVQ
jgi:hypothetical protein